MVGEFVKDEYVKLPDLTALVEDIRDRARAWAEDSRYSRLHLFYRGPVVIGPCWGGCWRQQNLWSCIISKMENIIRPIRSTDNFSTRVPKGKEVHLADRRRLDNGPPSRERRMQIG